MTRRANFRQADVARVLKAAKAAGAARVIVQRDGSISIEVENEHNRDPYLEDERRPVGRRREIVL